MSNSALALAALVGTTFAVLVASSGCAERLADCVEVYSGTGATRLPGYTMTACEDHCKQVQGAIDCYWDGSVAAISEPTVTVVTGKDSTAR